MRYFAPMQVEKSIEITAFGISRDVPLIATGGMIGMIPVFATREQAEQWADGIYDVITLETEDADENTV